MPFLAPMGATESSPSVSVSVKIRPSEEYQQKRIDQKRDGMFPCMSYGEQWTPNAFSQKNFLQEGFRRFGNELKNKYIKVRTYHS